MIGRGVFPGAGLVGSGGTLVLAAMIFFPLNALLPARGAGLVAETLGALVGGAVLTVAVSTVYHRLFDVKDD
jgi:hypothetical protein